MPRKAPPAAAAVVDPTTMERLRALGYVSGSGSTAPRDGVLKVDPKDGVHLLRPLNRGMSAAREHPEARHSRADHGLNEAPDLPMARRTRAVAFTAAGRHESAIAGPAAAREGRPDSRPKTRWCSATTFVWPGRRPRLRRSWSGSRARTRNSHSRCCRWRTCVEEGKHADAAALCERVLTIAPDQIEALRRLGDFSLVAGDVQAAGLRYSRILALDAADVPAIIKLGIVSIRSGRAEEATRLFQQAIALEPNNAEGLLYLAGALASGGRPAEALPYFERALKAGPPSTMALNGLGLTRLAVGDGAGAAAAFRESLRLNPAQAEVRKTLADLRANTGGR